MREIKNATRIMKFHVQILLDELDAMKEKFSDKKTDIERIEELIKGLRENVQ